MISVDCTDKLLSVDKLVPAMSFEDSICIVLPQHVNLCHNQCCSRRSFEDIH